MYRIKASIQGIAPMCFNRPGEALQGSLETGRTGGRRTREEAIAEAEARVYKNGQGLYIPATWVKKSMLNGCTLADLKQGRRGFYPYLAGGVFIVEREIPLGKETFDFMHERWGRIPPGPKGAAAWLRNPGVKEGWEASFTLMVADNTLGQDSIKAALEQAGMLVGLGNGRPDFGRFIVTGWEVNSSPSPVQLNEV